MSKLLANLAKLGGHWYIDRPLQQTSQAVKTLIEGYGGAIEVQSKVGKGSTFTVKLPIAGSEQK